MFIKGKVLGNDIIRLMLEKEYAFSISYEDGQAMHVAHHKGDWTLCHVRNGQVVRVFDIDDSPGMGQMYEADPILLGFFNARTEIITKRYGEGTIWYRGKPAEIIMEVINLLVGYNASIKEIDIKQAGRNAVVRLDGTFDLES